MVRQDEPEMALLRRIGIAIASRLSGKSGHRSERRSITADLRILCPLMR